jgi:hypothetical protein
MALGSLTRESVDAAFENVTIINFNYDRTVEHYLLSALQQKAALTSDKARTVVENLKIIRPYGSLGPLKLEQQAKGTAFGGDEWEPNNDLFAIASNIRTYTEQVDDGIQEAIHSAISSAKVVVFMGFGFHQQNMKLLTTANSSIDFVFATADGIDNHNHIALMRRIGSCLAFSGQAQLVVTKAHKMLQNLRLSIMQAAS